jgi:hypothetical protein
VHRKTGIDAEDITLLAGRVLHPPPALGQLQVFMRELEADVSLSYNYKATVAVRLK